MAPPMSRERARSAVEGLWKACGEDRVAAHPDTIAAFLFDVCMDWNKLLGLWQGVMKLMIGLPQEGDDEADWEDIKARVLREEAAMKPRVQQAAEDGRVVQFLVDVYTEFYDKTDYGPSAYWLWFEEQRPMLQERSVAGPIQQGSAVVVHGLKGAKDLNGAIGTVVAPPTNAPPSDRLPIKLRSPEAVVAARPGGVLVRPANLQALPKGAHAAVLLYGFQFQEAFAFDFEGAAGRRAVQQGRLPEGWMPCQVSQMLGWPLAMYQMASCWPPDQGRGVGVYLLVDPVTGIAPPSVLQHGVGPVLVARTDGVDLTVKDVASLHDYHTHLMDLWPDFESNAQRLAVLTPNAFRSFCRDRANEVEC